MAFDSTFGVQAVVEIAIPLVGVAGTWFTFRERLSQLIKRADARDVLDKAREEEQGKQHDDNQKRMVAIELQIARDCVKIDDFRRLEDRISEKFDKVEHAVNNASFKTVQLVKDMLFREGMPPRPSRE